MLERGVEEREKGVEEVLERGVEEKLERGKV